MEQTKNAIIETNASMIQIIRLSSLSLNISRTLSLILGCTFTGLSIFQWLLNSLPFELIAANLVKGCLICFLTGLLHRNKPKTHTLALSSLVVVILAIIATSLAHQTWQHTIIWSAWLIPYSVTLYLIFMQEQYRLHNENGFLQAIALISEKQKIQLKSGYFNIWKTSLHSLACISLLFGSQWLVLTYLVYQEYGTLSIKLIQRESSYLISHSHFLIYSGVIALSACSIYLWRLIRKHKDSGLVTFREYLGLRGFKFTHGLITIVIFFAVIFSADKLMPTASNEQALNFMQSLYKSADSMFFLWLGVALLPALVEELCFRGFLMPGLAKTALKPIGAAIVSSACWAAIHIQYDINGVLLIFSLGLVFAGARIISGSLILPILLHTLNNSLAIIGTAASLQ